MTSARKKGTDFQRWCKEWIIEQFPVAVVHNQPMNHVCVGNGKWICKSNDIFGCIDLIVIFGNCIRPLFIQASAHTKVEDRLEEFRKVDWPLNHVTVQLWQKKGPSRVVIREVDRNNDGDLCFRVIGEIVRRVFVREKSGPYVKESVR